MSPIKSIQVWSIALRSEFTVVMSVTISAKKRCVVRLYLQLFVGCLIYVICVCLRIVVSNAYCVAFFFFLFVLCTLDYIIYIQVTDIKLRYLKQIFNNIVISNHLPYKSSQDMSFLQQRKMEIIWLLIVSVNLVEWVTL
jgi:hypothetical protein